MSSSNLTDSFFPSKLLKKYYFLFLISVLFFLPCLFFCHLDEIVTVSGEIRPETSEASIIQLFSGTVTNVNYKNSQLVKAGELLFELDSSYEKQELLNLEKLKELYQNEEIKLANLINLIDNTDTESFPNQTNQEFTDSKCVAFISEYKKYKNQTKLAKDNFERQKLLFPIAISKTELEDYENSYLQAKYNFTSWLENQKIQSRESYTEITKNLQNCQIQIMQISKEILNSEIYAKSTGYINEINKIKVGDYIDAGTKILTIIPESEKLRCIASVPASNISKLKIGQDAILQFNDLPWTKYGKLNGKVSLVPSDSLQVSANSSQNIFPVEIILSQDFLQDRNKNKVYLHIGSTASVRIKISENTIFQKFLQSLVANE